MSRYRIPSKRARAELRVSNSRFIATIAPVADRHAVQEFIREIRAALPDATHHVHAFKIGYGSSVIEGLSDDGEPSGTAGAPALAVLRGADLGDVALVITRYFGGAKLGTGGLVAAYTQAAKAALAAVETEEKVSRCKQEITLPYPLYQPMRRILEECEARIEQETFAAEVRVCYLVAEDRMAELGERIKNLSGGKVLPRAV